MTRSIKILFSNLFSIILAYYVAVLLHEYGHGTTAWLFGYKKTPFGIEYGSWYLLPVDEGVNYDRIMAAGHHIQVGLIGISGIAVTTILFLISLYFLNRKSIQGRSIFLISFIFWLADINLMDIFSYIPNGTFMHTGDIGRFVNGLNISPLWIFLPGTLLICFIFYRFYKYEVIKMFVLFPIKTNIMRRIFLWVTFWPVMFLIVYWRPPSTYRALSYTANIFSVLLILLIIIVCDPSRNWVKKNAAHAIFEK